MAEHNIKCPHCGDSYYQYLHSTSTLMGWTPIYKDGVQVNKNPNKITKHFRCLNCGNNFSHTI